MSTFIDELRVDPPPIDGALSQRVTTGPISVWTGAPTQSRIRTIAPLERPQTLLLVRELDSATAVVGRRQLRGPLEIGRGPLVIDCSSVRLIDASWLGVLVSSARYARELGRKVTVAAPSPRVLRVLRLVGLEWLVADE
jgi:anti-sigma B factor antagonist